MNGVLPVHITVDLRGRLVNGTEDSSASGRQSSQRLDDGPRHVGVQPGGGLVTEHEGRVSEHLE